MKSVLMSLSLVVLLILTGCDHRHSSRKRQAPPPPPAPQQPQAPRPAPPPAPQQQQAPRPAPPPPRQSMGQEVSGVVNYGVGAAQVQAGQRMKNKINQINHQHNQDLDRALK